jgi:hypothetical protein
MASSSEGTSARISSENDPFLKQFFGFKSALFQFVAMERVVPELYLIKTVDLGSKKFLAIGIGPSGLSRILI